MYGDGLGSTKCERTNTLLPRFARRFSLPLIETAEHAAGLIGGPCPAGIAAALKVTEMDLLCIGIVTHVFTST
jgi:hypothetical protein